MIVDFVVVGIKVLFVLNISFFYSKYMKTIFLGNNTSGRYPLLKEPLQVSGCRLIAFSLIVIDKRFHYNHCQFTNQHYKLAKVEGGSQLFVGF